MNASNFIGGMIVGAAVGLATGLLIAPTSGNQTRKNIMKRSRVYSQQAVDAVRQYVETLKGKATPGEYDHTEELLNNLSRQSSL